MWKFTSMRATYILASILVFFTPLFFTNNTNELFEFPKMYLVYFLSLTLSFFLVLQIISKNQKVKTLFHSSLLVKLVLISTIISTIFSTHLYTSIWGYYTRANGGLMSLLAFFCIYLVFKQFEEDTFEKIFEVITLTILPISIYGIFQHFTLGENTRIYSTFGQPNWLAGYMVMILPIVIGKLISNNKNKLLWIILYALGFSTLWFTYSVSGILGFTVGFITLFIFEFKAFKDNFKYIALIIGFSLGIAILQPGIFKQKINDIFIDIQKVNAQTQNTPEQVSDSGFIRLNIWQGSTKILTESAKNAFIGIGPETFPYEFQKVRPKNLNYSSEWDYILNKPHNQYIETLVEEGLFGLIINMLLIIYSFRKGIPVLKSAFIGIYIANFFGWFTVSTSLLFWVYLSYIDKSPNS